MGVLVWDGSARGRGGRSAEHQTHPLNHTHPSQSDTHTRSFLLWSDVKKNRIYRWEEGGGLFTIGKSVYLEPSGCRSDEALCGSLVEPGAYGDGVVLVDICVVMGWHGGGDRSTGADLMGHRLMCHTYVTLPPPLGSNGLATEPGSGLLVMCEHGERRVSRYVLFVWAVAVCMMDDAMMTCMYMSIEECSQQTNLSTPPNPVINPHRLERNGTFTPLATHYQGKRLNSPNDLVFGPGGDLYFTDPPYGLNGKEGDPLR